MPAGTETRTERHAQDIARTEIDGFFEDFPKERVPDLSAFAYDGVFQEAVEAARKNFARALDVAEQSLNDPDLAVAVLRYPPGLDDSPPSDALMTVTLSIALGGCLTQAAIHHIDHTPFDLTRASSKTDFRQPGPANPYAVRPNETHVFHTDVFEHPETKDAVIPDRIALHNIYIGFKKSGDLLWLPFRRWSALEDFKAEVGLNRPYTLDVGIVAGTQKTIRVPLFSVTPEKEDLVCAAGRIVGPSGVLELDRRIRASMAESSGHIVIPQSTRQLVVLANKYGFHSRIPFEEPTDGLRILLRMMDERGTHLGQACD